jgi:hypothetical protein
MTLIYKYPLRLGAKRPISMPCGARILAVQNQQEVPTLWAEVDSEADEEFRTFHCVATGNEPEGNVYLGTLQFSNGQLVFHIYEQREATT